jgi:hypothetical protein
MVVHDSMRHHRQISTDLWCLLARECTPRCSGFSSSWSLLPTCELVFSRMMREVYSGYFKVGCILLLFSILVWVLEKLKARLSLILLIACRFVRPLPMSECFYWDLFYGTRLLSLCSIAEVVVQHGFTYSYQTMNRHGLFFMQMLLDTYPREYNEFKT